MIEKLYLSPFSRSFRWLPILINLVAQYTIQVHAHLTEMWKNVFHLPPTSFRFIFFEYAFHSFFSLFMHGICLFLSLTALLALSLSLSSIIKMMKSNKTKRRCSSTALKEIRCERVISIEISVRWEIFFYFRFFFIGLSFMQFPFMQYISKLIGQKQSIPYIYSVSIFIAVNWMIEGFAKKNGIAKSIT